MLQFLGILNPSSPELVDIKLKLNKMSSSNKWNYLMHFYSTQKHISGIDSGTAHFKKCKQLFQYQHLPLLETSGGQISNMYPA